MRDISIHCKVTIVLLLVFPISAMIAFAIATVAVEVPLYTMAIFACFWTLIPGIVQLIILILIVNELYRDDSKLKDLNQWWSTFGLVSSCNYFTKKLINIS